MSLPEVPGLPSTFALPLIHMGLERRLVKRFLLFGESRVVS